MIPIGELPCDGVDGRRAAPTLQRVHPDALTGHNVAELCAGGVQVFDGQRRVVLRRRSGGKPVVRYQLTADTGIVDGSRKPLRRRYATEKEARAALAEIRGQLAYGTYVQPSKLTLRQACEDWLAAKHGLKLSTVHGHRTNLTPVMTELGDVAVQDLSKRNIDDLVSRLRAGGLPSPSGKTRKSWRPRTVNYMLSLLTAALEDQVRQGHVVRNVAALVTRIPSDPKSFAR